MHIYRSVASPTTRLVPVDDEQTTTRQPAILFTNRRFGARSSGCRPEASIASALSKRRSGWWWCRGSCMAVRELNVESSHSPISHGHRGLGPRGGGHGIRCNPAHGTASRNCGGLGAAGWPRPLTPHSTSGQGPQGLPGTVIHPAQHGSRNKHLQPLVRRDSSTRDCAPALTMGFVQSNKVGATCIQRPISAVPEAAYKT